MVFLWLTWREKENLFVAKPQLVENKEFIGRDYERNRLIEVSQLGHAAIVTVYGRRRIGKTELIEFTFQKRHLLKFEGLEGKSSSEQLSAVLYQLAQYVQDPKIAKLQFASWLEVFELIAEYVAEGEWTLYLEELQWLANYEDSLITDLKYVWDNYYRHNPKLLLVLCGSSPSFMINHVIKSKALYNRSMYEIPLEEFTLNETAQFLKKHSPQEVMDAYFSVGGIPEYLKYLKQDSSIFLSLCQNAFRRGAPFVGEYERIFVSSLANNSHYQVIVEYLSKVKFATRKKISEHLKLKSGGYVTELLQDLTLCGFIQVYTPYNLNENSMLSRYCISDNFLMFYFKFIKPIASQISQGDFNSSPTKAINMDAYRKWQGYAFERFCRRNHRLIARKLGFEDVHYKSGVYFDRASEKKSPGYQIDLLYARDDKVFTMCEIKYVQSKVGIEVIEEFEKKLLHFSNPKAQTIQKVLISLYGPSDTLVARGYFDRFIVLEDFFQN